MHPSLFASRQNSGIGNKKQKQKHLSIQWQN